MSWAAKYLVKQALEPGVPQRLGGPGVSAAATPTSSIMAENAVPGQGVSHGMRQPKPQATDWAGMATNLIYPVLNTFGGGGGVKAPQTPGIKK